MFVKLPCVNAPTRLSERPAGTTPELGQGAALSREPCPAGQQRCARMVQTKITPMGSQGCTTGRGRMRYQVFGRNYQTGGPQNGPYRAHETRTANIKICIRI